MPSTPSPSLRIELQATGENVNQWGIKVNDNALVMLEQAITKVTPIALTGNKTLTVTNYVTDEARSAALIFTDGGMAANAVVTIPAVQKLYYVENRGATYSITFTAGGITGVLPAARKGFLICNGTDVTIFDPKADVVAIVTAAEAARDLSQSWASLMNALVAGAGYSSREYAIGDSTASGGSAKAWAIDTVSPDGSANLSAKSHAALSATSASNSASSASSSAGFASASAGYRDQSQGFANNSAASAAAAAASASSVDGPAISARIGAVETKNTTQDGRLTVLEDYRTPFFFSYAFR